MINLTDFTFDVKYVVGLNWENPTLGPLAVKHLDYGLYNKLDSIFSPIKVSS